MRSPKSTQGRLGLLAILWLVLVAGFWGLTTATDVVPDDRIVDTLLGAQQEGTWRPDGSLTEMGFLVDHYTDCVALTQGLGERVPPGSRLQQSMADLHLAPEGCAGITDKLLAVQSGQFVEGTPYFRYWHGYVLLSRPALAWTDMPTLRVTLATLLAMSFALLTVGLVRSVGSCAAWAFSLPLLLTSDLVALPMTTVHSIAWTVILLSGAGAVWCTRKWGAWGAAVCALMAGSTYVFVDLLTNPPAALIIFLAAVLAGSAGAGVGLARSVRVAAGAGLVWGIAYAMTWISKWAISATAFGPGAVMREIRLMIAFRLSGTNDAVEKRFGAATRANWETWIQLDSLVTVVVVICMLIAAVVVLNTLWKKRPLCLGWAATYAVLSLIPLAWYEIVSNHSQIHAWFTFRALPTSLAVLMLGVAMSARCSRPQTILLAVTDSTVSAATQSAKDTVTTQAGGPRI